MTDVIIGLPTTIVFAGVFFSNTGPLFWEIFGAPIGAPVATNSATNGWVVTYVTDHEVNPTTGTLIVTITAPDKAPPDIPISAPMIYTLNGRWNSLGPDLYVNTTFPVCQFNVIPAITRTTQSGMSMAARPQSSLHVTQSGLNLASPLPPPNLHVTQSGINMAAVPAYFPGGDDSYVCPPDTPFVPVTT